MMQALIRTAFPPVPGRARPFPWPWRDRAGRFSPLRAAVLALLLGPAAWVAGEALAGTLGPEPLKAALKEIGRWTMRGLLLTLAVTPAARLFAVPRLATLRRMIGLGVLAYVLLHLGLYAAHENFRWLRIGMEIVQRFYLTLGFLALLGLVVLGWTSTDGWVRQLGRGWKRLHWLVFPVALLALWHFFLQSKSQQWETVLAAGFLAWLLIWRALPEAWRLRLPVLLALAPAAALAAALVEYAWYALATKLPAGMILAANLDVEFGLRPALWVGLAGLAVPVLVALRRRFIG